MFEMNLDDIPQERLDRGNSAELCFSENGEEAPYALACQQTIEESPEGEFRAFLQ
jgi:hypothetical protein